MDFEIRAVIHFHYLQNIPYQSAAAKIKSVYGEASPTSNAVKYWYKKFRAGCKSFEDEPRSGRPKIIVDVDAIRTIFANYPFASAHYIAEELGISIGTTIRALREELGMEIKLAKWVPHFLSESDFEKRICMAKSMLKMLHQLHGTQRAALITCDESWIYLSNYHESKWCLADEEPPENEKKDDSIRKSHFFRILFGLWNCIHQCIACKHNI